MRAARLYSRSQSAVNVFEKTITDLESVNEALQGEQFAIDSRIAKLEAEIASLETESSELASLTDANAHFADRIKSFFQA